MKLTISQYILLDLCGMILNAFIQLQLVNILKDTKVVRNFPDAIKTIHCNGYQTRPDVTVYDLNGLTKKSTIHFKVV